MRPCGRFKVSSGMHVARRVARCVARTRRLVKSRTRAVMRAETRLCGRYEHSLPSDVTLPPLTVERANYRGLTSDDPRQKTVPGRALDTSINKGESEAGEPVERRSNRLSGYRAAPSQSVQRESESERKRERERERERKRASALRFH